MIAVANKTDHREALCFCLRELYWAEQFLLNNLPEFKAGALAEDMAAKVEEYYQLTALHVQGLKELFIAINEEPAERECESIYGLTDEVVDYFDKFTAKSELRDVLILSSLRKIALYLCESYQLLSFLSADNYNGAVADIIKGKKQFLHTVNIPEPGGHTFERL